MPRLFLSALLNSTIAKYEWEVFLFSEEIKHILTFSHVLTSKQINTYTLTNTITHTQTNERVHSSW